MTPGPIPKDPVYTSYITRHHQEVRHPSPRRTSSPFRPYSGLTYTDQQLQGSRSVYPHFHRPFNDHSRYLAVASGADRAAYRDLPRLPPPPWDGTNPADDGQEAVGRPRRPVSAPARSRAGSSGAAPAAGHPATLRIDLRGVTLTDNMTTPTGRPCYTMTALVEADLESGTPALAEIAEEPSHRVAVVQTYPVPPSVVGYGSGGARPFHQDYRHYKYYGFAGKGAKTSWAHNPKFSRIYADLLLSSRRDSTSPPHGDLPAQPLQQVVGGARRPLTDTERRLVKQFQWHNYEAEGVPSDPKVTRLLAHVASGARPTPRTLRHLKLPPQQQQQQLRAATGGAFIASAGGGGDGAAAAAAAAAARRAAAMRQYSAYLEGEIIEPYDTKVDLDRRRPLGAAEAGGRNGAARVTTYRQMSSSYAAEMNRSPNHGSQSPWHQRYGHYKYSGFAGKGATSSWARNPKYAFVFD